MEKTKPTPKRGRPPRVVEEKPAAKPKAKLIKRNVPDANQVPKVFEVVNGGGIYYKLRSRPIVFDEKTNTNRELRYCPAEKSVFKDEQSEAARVSPVVFRDKTLVVPHTQPNLLRYLELHPGNTANGGNAFRLLNEEVNVEKEIDNEFKTHDAISFIKARPIDELIPLAMALNIEVNQSNINIKRDLVRYAKSNPARFLDMTTNPLVEARSVVASAFDFEIIRNNGGAVVWTDTNKIIVSIPAGQDKTEVMTRFVMTDAGAAVLSEIERQLAEIA